MKKLLRSTILASVLIATVTSCVSDRVKIDKPFVFFDKEELSQTLYADATYATIRFKAKSDWSVTLYEIEKFVGKEIPDTLTTPNWIEMLPYDTLGWVPSDTITLRLRLEPNYIGLERGAALKLVCEDMVEVATIDQLHTIKSGRKLLNTRLVSKITGSNDSQADLEVKSFEFGYYKNGTGADKDNLSFFNMAEERGNYHNSYEYKVYNDDKYEGLEGRRIRIEANSASQGGIFRVGRVVTHLHRGHYVDYSELGNLGDAWDGTTGKWYNERIEYQNGAPVKVITESSYSRADNDTLDILWNKERNLIRIDRFQTYQGNTYSRYSYAYAYSDTYINKTNIDLNWFILATTSVSSSLNLNGIATFEPSHLNLAGLFGKRSKNLIKSAAETHYQSETPVSFPFEVTYEFDEWGYVSKFNITRGDGVTGSYTVEYVSPPIFE